MEKPLFSRRAIEFLLFATRSIFAWGIGLLWVIPFLGVFMSAVRPQEELLHGWWRFSPFTFTLENFSHAWTHSTASIAQGLWNSLLVAVAATLLAVFLGALAAYGFLQAKRPVAMWVFLGVVLLLALPQQMAAVPLFQGLAALDLINSYVGLIFVHAAWGLPWITMFLRNFFTTIPMELEEAARIDGASRTYTFFRILLPISLPGLASAAALQFNWVWNDFFFALILIYSPDMLLVTQRIPLLRGQYYVDWGLLSAAAILAMSVPILVFLLLQRYYVRGLVGWSVEK